MVLVTADAAAEASRIAEALLEKRLAACVNIAPQVASRFWWEGKLDAATESLLFIKTGASQLDEIVRLVREMHSNTVPEIIALPIIGGNREYLDWISGEVA